MKSHPTAIAASLRNRLAGLRAAGVDVVMKADPEGPVTSPELKEIGEKIAAKQKLVAEIFADAGPERDLMKAKALTGTKSDRVAEVRKINEELDELASERTDLLTIVKAARWAEMTGQGEERGDGSGDAPAHRRKSFGEQFVESSVFKTKGGEAELDVDLKTLMETGAGWAPQNIRTSTVVDYATRPIQVVDLVPQTTTGEAAVVWMEETTFTNNAAEAAEGATMGEAALVLTERTSTVRKIGVTLPVTDEQLADVSRLPQYLNNRLPFMVRQRLDLQILTGDGNAPNLMGILNTSNVQTQAKGTDPTPDALLKAAMKVNVVGQALADAAVLHPYDWQDIRLLRTADGDYIFGPPSDAGPLRVWGIRVALAQAETQNTGLVGDFGNFTELATRQGISVEYGYVNDDFKKGRQTLRCTIRCALMVYRPTAFCTVTGI